MKRSHRFYSLAFTVFLGFLTCCAHQASYMRVGTLETVLQQPHKANVAYGSPSVNIEIMKAWTRGTSMGSLVARSVGRKIDHERNEGVLDHLNAVGIQDHIRDTISEMMTPLLRADSNISIGETFIIPSGVTESKHEQEKIPAADELFTVDSKLRFSTYKQQMVTYLEIKLALQSRDKPRKILWQDRYLCELCSADGNLHENEGRYAKQLVAAAVEVLQAAIRRDLSSTASSYDEFPEAQLQTVGGLRIQGRLLEDAGGRVTLRLAKGMTRVMSKELVRGFRINHSRP